MRVLTVPNLTGNKVDFDELTKRLQAYTAEEAESNNQYACSCKAG